MKIRDQSEAPGSALWMAPEVLLGEKIDEKLDVYSFALVFWEILTRKEIFPQYTDKSVFREDIANKGIRLPLDDIDPVLCKILVKCWDRNPDLRPSFEQLLPLLEKALIDIYLPLELCPLAGVFWQKNFKYQARVPINDFVSRIITTLLVITKKTTIITEESLKMLLEEEEGDEKVVSIERFSDLLTWFGPMKQQNRLTILHQIIRVLNSPWFFGMDTSLQSERHIALLASKPRGLFLVRLNMGERTPTNKAPFTITRVEDDKGNVVHTRVYSFHNGLIIKPTEQQKFTGSGYSIWDFIEMLKKDPSELLTVPCPGWPFAGIFNSISGGLAYQEFDPNNIYPF
jgi:serine/threonine protein kinase